MLHLHGEDSEHLGIYLQRLQLFAEYFEKMTHAFRIILPRESEHATLENDVLFTDKEFEHGVESEHQKYVNKSQSNNCTNLE